MDHQSPPPPAVTTAVSSVDSSPLTSSSSSSSSSSGPKLRLMCSYGGHIVPRPLDKTLCYAGGETRIIAVDRRSAYSLTTLTNHLSKSLLNGRPFSLKYQLPNHDLDSLISISTDEDLANMIDEYDRLSPSRLRFFLFPCRSKPDSDLHDPKSEAWFIDALRNVGVVGKGGGGGGGVEGCGLSDSPNSLSESIVLEKSSSFGSTSSSASASNSPAIRNSGGGEEGGVGVQLQDFKIALPPADSIGSESSSIASPNFSQQAIVFQDASGFVESKVVSTNLAETESNASDRSPRGELLSPVQVSGYILSKPMDQQQQPQAPPQQQTLVAPPPPQPQYIHPASQSHYVTQYYTSSVPVASYPTMYQPYTQTQPPVQYQLNNPYPVYMMPAGQAQNPYDMASHPHVPSNPVMVASNMVYEGYNKPATLAPEYAAKVYSASPVACQPVAVSSDDHHHHHHRHQVVAFPPVNQPSQPVVVPPLENPSYVSEYDDPMHAQIYKTQPPGPVLPSQLQTPTNAATVMLSETLTQLQVENAKH